MSENLTEGEVRQRSATREQAAVGLVATRENTDFFLRELFEAVTAERPVFVTYVSRPVPDVVAFARRAGAVVVDPPPGATTAAEVGRRLAETVEGRTGREVTVRRGERAGAHTGVEESTTGEPVVVVPAYNEGASITAVVGDALSYTDVVVVVDDGSDDDTAERAEEAGALVVRHGRNRGYGAALRTGFRTAAEMDAEFVVTLDADGQHDPSDIPKLVEHGRETDANLVVGSRFAEGGDSDVPPYRRVGLWVINAVTNACLGCFRARSRISDTQSGFRAYDARAVADLATSPNVGEGMGASTDILYHAHHHDYAIEEVGTTISYDVEDGSTFDPVSHGYALVKNVFRTVERDRPLSVLGVPGFATILLGLAAGYWSVSAPANGGLSTEAGLFAAFAVLIGLLACFTALILHALHTYFDPV
jgi:hypothetical protein